MGALPGIIGSMMAAEAIKQITGAGKILSNQMLILIFYIVMFIKLI